ncbi:MAG: J domain-containing protein [Planctomycetota bacterium]|nr:J domain-containing protein [Planctomycetota bacterium]
MAEEYYKTLGLKRNATPDEIQKAYRSLARKHHPDMNPGDEKAKQRFKEVQKAYEILHDPEKRTLYDQYGSSFEAFQGGGGARPAGSGPQGRSAGGPAGSEFRFEDINDLFGGGGGASGGFADFFRQFSPESRAGQRASGRAATVEHELEIPFSTAVNGGEVPVRISHDDGKVQTLQVKIPMGIDSGQKVRVRGQGAPGRNGKPSDLIFVIKIAPHPCFLRQGRDLVVRVPISIPEAILGAKVDVPTPTGVVTVSIPSHTSSGKRLRIKGHGVRNMKTEPGDLYAEVQIVVPGETSVIDTDRLKEIDPRPPEQLRNALRW